jgi:hypothetical protein
MPSPTDFEPPSGIITNPPLFVAAVAVPPFQAVSSEVTALHQKKAVLEPLIGTARMAVSVAENNLSEARMEIIKHGDGPPRKLGQKAPNAAKAYEKGVKEEDGKRAEVRMLEKAAWNAGKRHHTLLKGFQDYCVDGLGPVQFLGVSLGAGERSSSSLAVCMPPSSVTRSNDPHNLLSPLTQPLPVATQNLSLSIAAPRESPLLHVTHAVLSTAEHHNTTAHANIQNWLDYLNNDASERAISLTATHSNIISTLDHSNYAVGANARQIRSWNERNRAPREKAAARQKEKMKRWKEKERKKAAAREKAEKKREA